MSALLEEIIAARKAKAIEYEEYLKRIADLVKQVEAGHEDDIDEVLKKSPALRALYNNLQNHVTKPEALAGNDDEQTIPKDKVLDLARKIDETVKRVKSDDWRGIEPRERTIKRALYEIIHNVEEVNRIFIIIKAQKEY